jgi:hypothetical protein
VNSGDNLFIYLSFRRKHGSVLSHLSAGLAVAVGLPLAVASRAASDGNSIKKDITLDSPTEVATTKLPAGTYRLTVNGTQATFEHDGKVIAKVPFMWKQLTREGSL